MIELDSHVTLAVIFSFIAMLGQGFSIYAILHTHTKEGTEKEVKMATVFGKLDTKLDFLSQRVDGISRNVEKSDQKLDDIANTLVRQDERLDNLEKRIEKLEGA